MNRQEIQAEEEAVAQWAGCLDEVHARIAGCFARSETGTWSPVRTDQQKERDARQRFFVDRWTYRRKISALRARSAPVGPHWEDRPACADSDYECGWQESHTMGSERRAVWIVKTRTVFPPGKRTP